MHAHSAHHKTHAPMTPAQGQQLSRDGTGYTRPAGQGMSGAGDSAVPASTADLVWRTSNRSSHREDLLEDLLSHMMDIKFQTAPRHQPAPVNPNDIQDVENSALLQLQSCACVLASSGAVACALLCSRAVADDALQASGSRSTCMCMQFWRRTHCSWTTTCHS